MKFASNFRETYGEKLLGLYKKYEYPLFAAAFLAVAVIMRLCIFDHHSNDYDMFLSVWFEEIKAAGGLSALAADLGDYTPMYKYIITLLTFLPVNSLYSYKAVSCLFDVVMAIYVGLIVRQLGGSKLKGLLAYAAVLFLPNVFLNSAVWAQCDAIFTCFCIMSFYYMLKNMDNVSVALYAVAFSFKLQAIFYAPVIVVAILRKRLNLRSLLCFPLTYFLCGLPAWIAGMSFFDAYFAAYCTQVGEYPILTLGAMNLYQLLPFNYTYENLGRLLVFFSVGVCAMFCLFFYKKNYAERKENWVIIAYTMTTLLPFVLPHMHERYFYISDIFAVLFAFTFPKKIYIPAATVYASLRAVASSLFGAQDLSFPAVAFLEFAAIVALCLFAFRQLSDKDKGKRQLPPLPPTREETTE